MRSSHLPTLMNGGPNSNKHLWIAVALVTLLTFVAHARALRGQFVSWDDDTHVTKNAAIRGLTGESLRTMFTQPLAKLYVPLTWLSFAVDYQIWGRDPFGYHLTNLLLHVANTALVLLLVHRLLKDRHRQALLVAAITAAIFGVHPLRVESVAWVTERKDVLFAFFYLLALGAYGRWAIERRVGAYWLCFGLFAASTLSKATAVTLPLVLLLLDAFVFRRRALLEKLPFFAVSVAITLATIYAQGKGEGQTLVGTEAIPLWGRLGLVGYCAMFYVFHFVWPFRLCAIYPTYDEMGWSIGNALSLFALFAAVTAAIVLARRRLPALLPCWLFYLITLSPTIGLLPVGIHVVADRFSYLPLLGLALLVALLVARWKIVGCAIAAALLLGWTALAAHRTAVWANTESLFQSVLRSNPNSLPASINLCKWYTDQQRYDEAIAQGQRAVEIAPASLIARKNLALALMKAGHPDKAIPVLRPAVEHNIDDTAVWVTLGECFAAVKDWPNAVAAFEAAIKHREADTAEIGAKLDEARRKLTVTGRP